MFVDDDLIVIVVVIVTVCVVLLFIALTFLAHTGQESREVCCVFPVLLPVFPSLEGESNAFFHFSVAGTHFLETSRL